MNISKLWQGFGNYNFKYFIKKKKKKKGWRRKATKGINNVPHNNVKCKQVLQADKPYIEIILLYGLCFPIVEERLE